MVHHLHIYVFPDQSFCGGDLSYRKTLWAWKVFGLTSLQDLGVLHASNHVDLLRTKLTPMVIVGSYGDPRGMGVSYERGNPADAIDQ